MVKLVMMHGGHVLHGGGQVSYDTSPSLCGIMDGLRGPIRLIRPSPNVFSNIMLLVV